MTPTRQTLRRFTWLALTAMLGLALAPTVSRALSAMHPAQGASVAMATLAASQHEDCDEAARPTSDAPLADAPAAGAPLAHHAAHDPHGSGTAGDHDHLNHCPMCGIAATAWSVAPAPPLWGIAPHTAERQALPVRDAAPRGFDAESAHRPRGPPSLA